MQRWRRNLYCRLARDVKGFFFFIGMGNERTLRESFVVGGFIFTKHALIKINNKSFFFLLCLRLQRRTFAKYVLWEGSFTLLTSSMKMNYFFRFWNETFNGLKLMHHFQFFEKKKNKQKKNEENFLKKKKNKRNQMKTDFVRSN